MVTVSSHVAHEKRVIIKTLTVFLFKKNFTIAAVSQPHISHWWLTGQLFWLPGNRQCAMLSIFVFRNVKVFPNAKYLSICWVCEYFEMSSLVFGSIDIVNLWNPFNRFRIIMGKFERQALVTPRRKKIFLIESSWGSAEKITKIRPTVAE